MFGTIQMDVYMNIHVFEAALPQMVAIRYCTRKTKRIRVPPFRYLGCVLQYAVLPHTPVHHSMYASLAFALFSFSPQSITKLPLKHGSKTTCFLALINYNRVNRPSGRAPPAGPSGGASGGPPSPAGGGQGPRRSRDRSRLRRNHQYTGRVQCTGI